MGKIAKVFEYFEAITVIPHCSYEADGLQEYLVDFAADRGYEVEVDVAGNILARRGEPVLCLQAHYDMVCVGSAPKIEIVEDEGWLRALDSSLGADNGIAVAMMMALMEEGRELEFLFTADEEVGLIGAKALVLPLRSAYLLNLDTEEEGAVYIGCAGGVDLIASRQCEKRPDQRPAWRVSVSGLPGGHSGVDIDKDIPNAIKVLAHYLTEREVGIVSLSGGERRNSIPVHAEAIVRSELPLEAEGEVKVEALDAAEGEVFADSESLVGLLTTAPHGVVARNEELGIPESSLNLAIVKIGGSSCRIDYSLRAMSDEELDALVARTETFLGRYAFDVKTEDRYPAWKPDINDFTRKVASIMEESFGESELKAIHAGLECGILSKKYPAIKMASIGPTIENPHSVRERVEIGSVIRTFEILQKIVTEFGA